MSYEEALLTADGAGERPLRILVDIFKDVDTRLKGTEAGVAPIEQLLNELLAGGEALYRAALEPLIARYAAAADPGVLFTASSLSTVAIGTGLRTFVVDEAERGAFAPAAFLLIAAADGPGAAMMGRKVAWDREAGTLVVDVLDVEGSGSRVAWTITAGARPGGASQLSVAPVPGFGSALSAQTLLAAIAGAIGNDPAFATTIAEALAARHTKTEIATLLTGKAAASGALAALGALPPSADRVPMFASESGATTLPAGGVGKALLAAADQASARAALGATSTADVQAAIAALVNGAPGALDQLNELAAAMANDPNFSATMINALAGKQPISALLSAIVAAGSAANKLAYYSGAGVAALADLSAFGRSLIDDADSAAARVTLAVLGLAGGTLSGPLALPAGSLAAPALKVGPAATGVYVDGDGNLVFALGGVDKLKLMLGASEHYGSGSALVRSIGDNAAAGFSGYRYSPDAGGAAFTAIKGRGSRAFPASPAQNDALGSAMFGFVTAANPTVNRIVAQLQASVIAATPSDTDGEAQLLLSLAAAGSVTPTEFLKGNHATGLSLRGAVVIDQNRSFRLQPWTYATLPAASLAAGQQLYCTDLAGGGAALNSNGSAWRRLHPGSSIKPFGSGAAINLSLPLDGQFVRHTGVMTADQPVNFATTGATAGDWFWIIRKSTGAFNLVLNAANVKNLAPDMSAFVMFDGSVWIVALMGSN